MPSPTLDDLVAAMRATTQPIAINADGQTQGFAVPVEVYRDLIRNDAVAVKLGEPSRIPHPHHTRKARKLRAAQREQAAIARRHQQKQRRRQEHAEAVHRKEARKRKVVNPFHMRQAPLLPEPQSRFLSAQFPTGE